MKPYPLSLQLGMKRFHGHLFLGPNRLYFVCQKQGGAWAAALGAGLGGAIGGAIVGLASSGPGQAPVDVEEAHVAHAVATNEGSLIMEASQIEEIKETIWWRLIRWNGKKFGLPNGLGKPLKADLGQWAKYHNVKTKGLG
jgi:hypothetical protein